MRRIIVHLSAVLLVLLLSGAGGSSSASIRLGTTGTAAMARAADIEPLGTCTATFCGRVTNAFNSDVYLHITDNWPPETGLLRVLARGQRSTYFFKDTDGFRVPDGCVGLKSPQPVGTYGPGWHKINDLFNGTIHLQC